MASASRQAILDKIRSATEPAQHPRASDYAAIRRDYQAYSKLDSEGRLALMIERLREYDAEVVECSPADITTAVAAQITASGRRIFVAARGIPQGWLTPGVDWRIDRDLPADAIEQAEGVLTDSSCGIADSGTIVLHHSPAEGRRIITLLPDWHLCILRASQIVETLPEYFARCSVPPKLATYISGPSATADIEMTRIKGVHGPRFLHVLIVRDDR